MISEEELEQKRRENLQTVIAMVAGNWEFLGDPVDGEPDAVSDFRRRVKEVAKSLENYEHFREWEIPILMYYEENGSTQPSRFPFGPTYKE